MRRYTGFLMILLVLMVGGPTISQAEPIRLGLQVSEMVANDPEARALLDTFEAENPGIEVELVSNNNRIIFVPDSPDEIGDYVNNIRAAATAADVFAVDSNGLLPEATMAGYVLDLMPLVQDDTDLDPGVFVPQAWDAVQWDRGFWFMPVTYNIVGLLYNPTAFEAANVPAPTADWMLADLQAAVDVLAADTEDPVFYLNDSQANGMLLAAYFAGDVQRDTTQLPAMPTYDAAGLSEFVATLARMNDDGQLVLPGVFQSGFEAPLRVTSASWAAFRPEENQVVPLPGGLGLQATGFAVSRGTDHPEAAYALTKFLSSQLDFTFAAAMGTARTDAEAMLRMANPQELAALSDELLPLARPWPEFHYANYLSHAIVAASNGTPPEQALEDTQLAVEAALAELITAADDVTVTVNSPPVRVVSSPDAIVLNFAVGSTISPAPTRGDWQRLADDFIERNPDVAEIDFTFTFGFDIRGQIDRFDCFYSPDQTVTADSIINLRNLDPLLDDDPAFNTEDYFAGVLDQFTLDGQMWGLPMTMEPYMMWVNRAMFEAAGAPMPQGTWTADEFLLAIDALNASEAWADEKIISVYENGQTYLHLLMAGFGGAPFTVADGTFDIHTDDPNTLTAIQQVLDLARDGDLEYLSGPGSGSGVTPILITVLNDANVRSGNLTLMSSNFGAGASASDYEMIPFPQGDVVPMAFTVGGAFITANSQQPELCYAFIRAAADDPTLFSSVPVRFSTLDDPQLAAVRRESDLMFYQQMADILARPDVLVLPTWPVGAEFEIRAQLERAFDAYVDDGADLPTVLTATTETLNAFLTCIEDADPPAEGEPPAWFVCAEAISTAG